MNIGTIGFTGQGASLSSEIIKRLADDMRAMEYQVILANEKTIEILKAEPMIDKQKNLIYQKAPMDDNVCAVVTDRELKKSILKGLGII